MTEHDKYHQVTINTLSSIDQYLSTLVLYSNLLLTLFGVTAAIVVYHLYKKR